MKFFNSVLLTALLSFIAGIYISYWWFFAVIAFLVALLIHQRGFKAFFAGFFSIVHSLVCISILDGSCKRRSAIGKDRFAFTIGRIEMVVDDRNGFYWWTSGRLCSA
jgi:cytochrome c biogenesis protein CcdA